MVFEVTGAIIMSGMFDDFKEQVRSQANIVTEKKHRPFP